MFVALCRQLWIVVDHCELIVAGCGFLWVIMGRPPL